MTERCAIRFELDGAGVELDIPPASSALEVLRGPCGNTSVKPACRIGRCGACMILLDGAPVNACLVLAARLDGRRVVTATGLREDGHARTIRSVFVEEGALQCGYCTPGLIVSLTAARRAGGGAAELEAAVAAHLCRCTGYGGLRRALARLAGD